MRKIKGILGLLAQCAAICFWVGLTLTCIWILLTNPEHNAQPIGYLLATFVIAIYAAIAAGTIHCLRRQFQWVGENERLMAWLAANAEKIRNNHPVYCRSQRITLGTVLVRYHIVFSALIISTRYQTRWMIQNKEPRFWHVFSCCLYTCFYGWWGLPFGVFWTPIALVKNLAGSTTVGVAELLQPAPADPVSIGDRFRSNLSRDLRGGFFMDEKPKGVLPAETAVKV